MGTRGWFLPLGSVDTCTGILSISRHPRKSLSSGSSASKASDLQWFRFLGIRPLGSTSPSPLSLSISLAHSSRPLGVR